MGKTDIKIPPEEVMRLYEARFSVAQIAAFFNVSRQAVYLRLHKQGVFRPGGIPPVVDLDALKAESKRLMRIDSKFLIRRDRIVGKAYAAVAKAISTGMLVPQPCEVCGESHVLANGQRGVQAHHDDYSRPIDVRWLCPKHHMAWHKDSIPKYE